MEPPQHGRCGMCGNCGGMPPWAPERLRELSAQQKEELFAKMREKQEEFVKELEARRAALREENVLVNDVHKNVESLGIDQAESEEEQKEEAEEVMVGEAEMDQVTLDSPSRNLAEHELVEDTEFDSWTAGVQVQQEDPNQISNMNETAQVEEDDDDDFNPRQPAVEQNEDFNPRSQTIERSSGPSRSSQDPQSSADSKRASSQRDLDSDADSFHTADEENSQSPNSAPRPSPPPLGIPERTPPASQSALLTASTVDLEEPSTPMFVPQESPPPPTTQIPLTPSVPAAEAPTVSMLDLEKHPSEDLEATVSARRHSRKNSLQAYPLPTDLVTIPRECADCERWRTRVRELEMQVEALTSALAAREMEVAGLKRGRVRVAGKNEARLMQECESLRFTTNFLYRRLEKYEGETGDVH